MSNPALRLFPRLLAACAFLGLVGQFLASSPSLDETELTPELVAGLEPRLSTPQGASQLGSYDKLVFGKGDWVRLEGKSRRCVVLLLDKYGRYFVKLYDLPESSIKDSASRGLLYFTGVCSRMEKTAEGRIEVSITYAYLSVKPDRFFTAQAQAFSRRSEEEKRKREALLAEKISGAKAPAASAAEAKTTVSSGKSPQQAAAPSLPAPKPPSKPPAGGRSKPVDADDLEGDTSPDTGRPALIRRGSPPEGSPPPTGASSVAGAARPETGLGVSTADSQDNVIYRPRQPRTATTEMAQQRKTPPTNRSSVKLAAADMQTEEVDGMALIPAGDVTLGSNDPKDAEHPLHRVSVESFYLDKYEVTNEEYKQYCDATGHAVPPYWKDKAIPNGLEKHPVVQVTWMDAVSFAQWAGKRLPTEAEWERAAKGPNVTQYAYGNAYDAGKANTEGGKTAPVGVNGPNGYGLCDMTGNVSEWVSSLFKPYPYNPSDGREEVKANGPRSLRGGNFSSGPRNSRCLVRADAPPDQTSPTVGFRCARNAQ